MTLVCSAYGCMYIFNVLLNNIYRTNAKSKVMRWLYSIRRIELQVNWRVNDVRLGEWAYYNLWNCTVFNGMHYTYIRAIWHMTLNYIFYSNRHHLLYSCHKHFFCCNVKSAKQHLNHVTWFFLKYCCDITHSRLTYCTFFFFI